MGDNNSTSGESNVPKPARFPAAVLPIVGLVAVVVGGLVAWSNANAPFWFAYSPLSNQPFAGNGVAFVSQGTQIGSAVGRFLQLDFVGRKFCIFCPAENCRNISHSAVVREMRNSVMVATKRRRERR